MSPLLTCLVPVRNGARDLPGFLDSIGSFCDAVVALDDGSTDQTFSILQASSLVQILIGNPRRDTYEGWDDCRNRSQLLEAAAALEPRWLLWVDADERLPLDEGMALREFVEMAARPDHAYGFRIFPLRGDEDHYEDRFLWIYRLFHYSPGQVLESRRLHLFPIPTQIPASRWVRTTIRFQHLGGLTAERRRDRFEKYRQADPGHDYQSDYAALLREPPRELASWRPRHPGEPWLWGDLPTPPSSMDHPRISFFLIPPHGSDGQKFLGESIRMFEAADVPAYELVLVLDAFSAAEPAGVSLNGAALDRALDRSTGDIICFLFPDVRYPPSSYHALVTAHDAGFSMVTGCRPTDAAPPGRSRHATSPGVVISGQPRYCSWTRSALVSVGGFPPFLSPDGSQLNALLIKAGHQAYWCPDVVATFPGGA